MLGIGPWNRKKEPSEEYSHETIFHCQYDSYPDPGFAFGRIAK